MQDRLVRIFVVLLVSFSFQSSFAIDVSMENGGAGAGYPIDVPAWNGMEPRISLIYSGQGNGPLGAGWSLKVGSTIIRKAKEGPLPTYNLSLDAFMLDGQKLERCDGVAPWNQIPGALFCARQNNGVRITPDGDLHHWEITNPDGQVMKYHPMFKVQPCRNTSGGPCIQRWGMVQMQSSSGQEVDYQYAYDNGTTLVAVPLDPVANPKAIYPAAITYNAGRVKVVFIYDDGQTRPDADTFATGGGPSHLIGGQIRYRLMSISVLMKDDAHPTYALERAYDLEYSVASNTQRSLLTSIKRRGRIVERNQPDIPSYAEDQGFFKKLSSWWES